MGPRNPCQLGVSMTVVKVSSVYSRYSALILCLFFFCFFFLFLVFQGKQETK
jgi:hypothetical protein